RVLPTGEYRPRFSAPRACAHRAGARRRGLRAPRRVAPLRHRRRVHQLPLRGEPGGRPGARLQPRRARRGLHRAGVGPPAAGALCGLAALTRPEAILFGTGVGTALAATGGRRALARFAPGFAGPLAALELFRLAYYGAPLPNTFYAKVGLQVPHGLWYLWQF